MNNDNNKHFLDLREKYADFIYKGYKVTNTDSKLLIEYNFEIKGLSEFNPKWEIDKLNAEYKVLDNAKLEELIFSLGMVELVSYWKLTCSKNVHILNKNLSNEQIIWWKKLYFKGLGEFFYLNKITYDDSFINDFMNIIPDNTTLKEDVAYEPLKTDNEINKPKTLIPIGGGKDSVVTISLLKDKTDAYAYIINPRGATLDTVDVANLNDKLIVAKRTLDKNMIDLNKQGFLNGHTPFSAIVAFSSVIASYINGLDYVALSNESSANESTVIGLDVNHQYSKSYEFETDFRNYEKDYINTGVEYFSMLRPLSELQIAKLFSNCKDYHKIFRSCNAGSKENKWCTNCPKCLFVYIILSPFLTEDELINIFGKNMLDDENMLDDFEKLMGAQQEKPFECVGSIDEVNIALTMTLENLTNQDLKIPYLLRYYDENRPDLNVCGAEFMTEFNIVNALPPFFLTLLKNTKI